MFEFLSAIRDLDIDAIELLTYKKGKEKKEEDQFVLNTIWNEQASSTSRYYNSFLKTPVVN